MVVFAARIEAATLPGFGVQQIAITSGFCSSLAVDSRGILYYTTTSGDLFHVDDNGASAKVAHVATQFIGNAGLLGMALLDDATAIVHYTTPGPAAEVISRIDLGSGAETVVARIFDDPEVPGRIVPSEHHGGQPVAGDNGSVYVGIGDFGTFLIAARPEWIAGKILRIGPNGNVTQLASGFRNPFGMAWDPAGRRLVVADNGDVADDEINIVTQAGGFFGWPYTMGTEAPYPGAVPPIYTFTDVVAPTGMTRLSGRNPILRSGYLLGAFVAKSVYFIPDIDARPLPDPIALVSSETGPVIGVAESPAGGIFFATGSAIYRLTVPARGDCNGDGLVNFADLAALDAELAGGDHPVFASKASWGCDVDGDGVISASDRVALLAMLHPRRRGAR
jgi:glucose/arabinose dehydrogenase